MKKQKIVVTSFLGVCLITGLSACGALAATSPQNNNSPNTSYQAQESTSTEDKSDNFQTDERPGESTDYSIYEPYGLKYEQEKQYYTYNGDIVRFFNDPVAGVSFTNFFTGTVDIEAERDKDNNLIGIKECSEEVYAQHTEKHNGANSTGGIANNNIMQDEGTSSHLWLKDYADYNITYNEQDGGWYYNNQKIKILLDSEQAIVYIDEENGICISVTRNSNNKISEVKEISETDALSILQNNSPTGTDITVQE